MGEDHPIKNSHDDVEIRHETGRKDGYLVTVNFPEETDRWSPTNRQIFELMSHMFESEDYEFGDGGYGKWLFWYNISLIALGHEEEAFESYKKSGKDALDHFDEIVDKHADDLIRNILKIKDGDKEGL